MQRFKEAAAAALPATAGDGMAELVRDFDWARTSLGPARDWPPELKTAVQMILESRFPAAIIWGPGLHTIYNDAFRPILGEKPEALGRSWAEIWSEVWPEIAPITERAFAGQATYIEDLPLVIERSGAPEQAWFTFCYSPVRLGDGRVGGMIDTVIETTASVKARAAVEILNNEISHRLKNTLSIVQAIAAQTLKGVTEREPVNAFQDRIVAMGRAHELLLRQNWSAASLAKVIDAALSPLDGLRQIAASGPEVRIGPQVTMSLLLVLHELATNATKYGALSSAAGRVVLDWGLEGDSLQIRWSEAGGPKVVPPTHRGFGTRLLDLGLGAGTKVTRRYPPEGFEARLQIPLRNLLLN